MSGLLAPGEISLTARLAAVSGTTPVGLQAQAGLPTSQAAHPLVLSATPSLRLGVGAPLPLRRPAEQAHPSFAKLAHRLENPRGGGALHGALWATGFGIVGAGLGLLRVRRWGPAAPLVGGLMGAIAGWALGRDRGNGTNEARSAIPRHDAPRRVSHMLHAHDQLQLKVGSEQLRTGDVQRAVVAPYATIDGVPLHTFRVLGTSGSAGGAQNEALAHMARKVAAGEAVGPLGVFTERTRMRGASLYVWGELSPSASGGAAHGPGVTMQHGALRSVITADGIFS